MLNLNNKIVLITGASSGIGMACAHVFSKERAKLILCARRMDRLKKLSADLQSKYQTEIYSLSLDVRNKDEVQKQIQSLPEKWKNIEVLINNAGLSRGLNKIQEGDIEDWEEMIDTNIKGLLYVTRNILPLMIKNNNGHIINIGSIAGEEVYQNGNVYNATKFAVKALNKAMKLDTHGTAIRISSVNPGLVETEFSEVRFRGDMNRAKQVYQGMQPLTGEDIAEIVLFCVTRPAHVNISQIGVIPTDQSSATMVNRKA